MMPRHSLRKMSCLVASLNNRLVYSFESRCRRVDDARGLGISFLLSKFDGIYGLGWPAISVDGIRPPILELAEKGLIEEPIFAFHMGTANGEDGEMTIGGYHNSDITGIITWLPLTEKDYWVLD